MSVSNEGMGVNEFAKFERDGYVMLGGLFPEEVVACYAVDLSQRLERGEDEAVLQSRGSTYGARDLIRVCPEVVDWLRESARLRKWVETVLGRGAGIVRVLYFDKPPERSWSLPWHRDRTIAVKRNDLPSRDFTKPTMKAGVPHVQAPDRLLRQMLTLRLHLDPMTSENGPLSVVPGSHELDEAKAREVQTLEARAGDVLAMRPLLSHSSTHSRPGTSLHRRIVHFELASCRDLWDGMDWSQFIGLDEA